MKISIPRDAVRESVVTPKRVTKPIEESDSDDDSRQLIDVNRKGAKKHEDDQARNSKSSPMDNTKHPKAQKTPTKSMKQRK